MLSEKMQAAINEQIKNELYSSYLYLAMSAHCAAEGLPGTAVWLRMQAQEELEHALKFFDYVNERGGRVELHAIDKPAVHFESPRAIFEEVLAHEQKVTALINNLYEVALAEKDYPSQIMLQWFINEQVEEEASVNEILDLLKLMGDKGHALAMLDRQLGQREAD
ncbi:MAG: ferritin [Anaerolineae bacterium]|nr:ferritin [Anaerolineae bacterium]